MRFTVSIMLSMTHNHEHQSKFITLCQEKNVFWVLPLKYIKLRRGFFFYRPTPDWIKYFLLLLRSEIKGKFRVIAALRDQLWC